MNPPPSFPLDYARGKLRRNHLTKQGLDLVWNWDFVFKVLSSLNLKLIHCAVSTKPRAEERSHKDRTPYPLKKRLNPTLLWIEVNLKPNPYHLTTNNCPDMIR